MGEARGEWMGEEAERAVGGRAVGCGMNNPAPAPVVGGARGGAAGATARGEAVAAVEEAKVDGEEAKGRESMAVSL